MKSKKQEKITSWSNFVDTMFIENEEHTFDESLQNQKPPVTISSHYEAAPEHTSEVLKCKPEDDRLIMMDFTGYDPLYILSLQDDCPYSIGDFRPSDSHLMMMQVEDKHARRMRRH